MIETFKKIAEMWLSLPIVPRRILLYSVFGGFIAYLTLRIAWVLQNLERLEEMTFFQFLGF